MKLTKTQLKQIIKEEVEDLYTNPDPLFRAKTRADLYSEYGDTPIESLQNFRKELFQKMEGGTGYDSQSDFMDDYNLYKELRIDIQNLLKETEK